MMYSAKKRAVNGVRLFAAVLRECAAPGPGENRRSERCAHSLLSCYHQRCVRLVSRWLKLFSNDAGFHIVGEDSFNLAPDWL